MIYASIFERASFYKNRHRKLDTLLQGYFDRRGSLSHVAT